MHPVIPEVDAPMLRVAEDQPEFVPVTVACVSHPEYMLEVVPPGREAPPNTHLLAFALSEEERAQIAAGADLYVSLLTFGGPMQGLLVLVGRERAAEVYQVAVKPRLEVVS
jgi:hypothetical protein